MLKAIVKIISSVLVLLLSISLLAGCQTKGTKDTEGTAVKGTESTAVKKAAQVSFVLWGSDYSGAKDLEDSYNSVIEDYEKQSGNTIEFLLVPTENYRTWTITQQAANQIPDVLQTKLNWVWEDYNKGLVINLSPYLEKESPYNKGMKWKDTFTVSLLQQSINPVENNLCSVPSNVTGVRILYNKDIFKKAGITKEPETWEEFMNACKKIQDMGKVPFSAETGDAAGWFLTSITGQLDGSLRKQMDVDGDNMVINNEFARATDKEMIDYTKSPFKDAFELLKEFSVYWNSDFNGADGDVVLQYWLLEKTAMICALPGQLTNIEKTEGHKVDFGAFPLPTITKETNPNASGMCTMLGGAANESYTVSSSAKDVDAAVDFVMYLTCPDAQGKIATAINKIPTIINAVLPDKLKGFIIRDNEDIRRANYFGPVTSEKFYNFYAMSLQLYLIGEVDYETFAKDLNEEWKKAMESLKTNNGWTEENNYGMAK
jgi:ABC-type glycerol-3-phosphate transport system substrate-binding protein